MTHVPPEPHELYEAAVALRQAATARRLRILSVLGDDDAALGQRAQLRIQADALENVARWLEATRPRASYPPPEKPR